VTTSPASLEGRCNCLAIRKAARYLSAAYDKALAPAGLRSTQFSILQKLATLGPVTIKQLAAVIAMDRTTLATNLKPLERQGLVETSVAEDRRARNIAITELGRARFDEALPLWENVQETFEGRFGEPEAAALRASLRSVLETGFEPWAE
jgi:DNA-binding MarR family transcriptional regulator